MRSECRIRFAHSRWLVVFVVVAVSVGLRALPHVASAAGPTAVSVSAPTQPIGPGEQFSVSVSVVPGSAIAGMQFDLSFNASLAAASKVEEGGLLKQGGANSFFSPGTIDNQAGKITGVFGAITTPGRTVSTPGTFASITFTSKPQSGSCPLVLAKVVVGDINGNPVTVSVVSGAVTMDRPPVLNAIGNKSINEGATLSFAVSATDADGDALTYSAANLPVGAAFNPSTRTFSWTPSQSQAGVYTGVHFQVSDGQITDYEDIIITVSDGVQSDVNSDGAVNSLDMIRVGQHWNETGASGWIREDINKDGSVNVLDATLVGQHWTG